MASLIRSAVNSLASLVRALAVRLPGKVRRRAFALSATDLLRRQLTSLSKCHSRNVSECHSITHKPRRLESRLIVRSARDRMRERWMDAEDFRVAIERARRRLNKTRRGRGDILPCHLRQAEVPMNRASIAIRSDSITC